MRQTTTQRKIAEIKAREKRLFENKMIEYQKDDWRWKQDKERMRREIAEGGWWTGASVREAKKDWLSGDLPRHVLVIRKQIQSEY